MCSSVNHEKYLRQSLLLRINRRKADIRLLICMINHLPDDFQTTLRVMHISLAYTVFLLTKTSSQF